MASARFAGTDVRRQGLDPEPAGAVGIVLAGGRVRGYVAGTTEALVRSARARREADILARKEIGACGRRCS